MTETICPDVLLVSGDIATTRSFLEALAGKGIRGTPVPSAAAAAERIEQRPWDLVVVDLEDAATESIALVRLIKCHYPELPVVMLSGHPSVAAAVRAIREGCHDYLAKPVDRAQIEALLDSLLPSHAVAVAAADGADARGLYQIAGHSPRLFETIALAKRVAPTSLPVLITGESGTGKELISYLVHRSSRRAQGPYVRVNCAALSESLLESELFGHERGAFTGACVQHKGRFE
ncbi:MAG: sigma 54-interacting transcriptional regulator, partial [Planctomycetota bacterium]|nr:sigma 54-interacting transcriptional regulator [Planctomycetota bacterium]